MAFGNKVTELSQIAVGTVGYVVRADTTSLLAYSITAVQVQADPADTPAPVTEENSLDTLLGYVNDTEAPDAAFNYGYGEVHIFLKASVYAYITTTRFVLIGKRNPIKITDLEDKLDIPDKDMELFLSYCLKYGALLTGNQVPYTVDKTIREKELEITNANT